MNQTIRETRERITDDNSYEEETGPSPKTEYTTTVLERVIYFVGGIILAFIALRILLSLLGANKSNAFASLIYNVSHPFVAPFFGLFNYQMRYGVSRFEYESFIALLVWGLVIFAIARLVTIGSRHYNS